ncbi:MAG TPA: addiction module protein [Pyrinomonadaceae bacterium]|nr:addiction module protein [Pyrinomonadaceae bacterium]
MSKAFEDIAREASQLSRQQKFDLAGLLLEINDDLPQGEASCRWAQEIQARTRAVDEGKAEGFSFEDVMRDAESKLTS